MKKNQELKSRKMEKEVDIILNDICPEEDLDIFRR